MPASRCRQAGWRSGNIAGLSAPRQHSRVSVVIPVWNGLRWLDGCLGSLAVQTLPVDDTIIVDNGSVDGSVVYVRERFPEAVVIELAANTGFAHAANVGTDAATGDVIALLNTDVVLAPDWLERMVAALVADPGAGSVACKMLSLDRPEIVYDAGDVLRRDGACEQRGRFGLDDGRFDQRGEVFGACAGAALYRRRALVAVGGFDERYFAYLEDVDLALRLRLSGWRCRYEPAVAWHAGEGSSHQLPGGHRRLVERNTLVLVAKAFPARWLPLVAYRQLSWAWHAWREGRLGEFGRGALQALPLLPGALRARRGLRTGVRVTIDEVVAARPIRGPRAGGHPSQHAPGVSADRSPDRAVR
jgi:GT2 family glycosyltransferase